MAATLAGFRAYALARGDNAPTLASDVLALAALVRGSDMIRLRYVANLCGYDITLVPDGSDLPIIEEAAYIAASLELATPGFFSRTYTSAESKVLTQVGTIHWTVVGKTGGAYAYMPSSSLIDALFAPYLCNGFPAILVV